MYRRVSRVMGEKPVSHINDNNYFTVNAPVGYSRIEGKHSNSGKHNGEAQNSKYKIIKISGERTL